MKKNKTKNKKTSVGEFGETNGTAVAFVCQSLMVWSSGRPGHLRLLPDNEYDEDG